MAEDVLAVVEDSGLDEVVLVGHSLGSVIAYDTLNRLQVRASAVDAVPVRPQKTVFATQVDVARAEFRPTEFLEQNLITVGNCWISISGPLAIAEDQPVESTRRAGVAYRVDDCAAALEAMKSDAWLINIARGPIVVQSDLAAALDRGSIAGAALDVFEREPLKAINPLWGLPGSVVSPHMSGDVVGWREDLVELFLDNLARYLDGRELRNVVDKRRGYVPG